MWRRTYQALILSVLLVLPATSVTATFGCTVTSGSQAYLSLHAGPVVSSRTIRRLPIGAMVSLLDYPKVPHSAEWAWVSHAADGNRHWGLAKRGWVQVRHLQDCG